MAAAAATIRGAVPAAERCSFWTGTPEIYFSKAIDNSRLVKVEDPRRAREMRNFVIVLCCLILLVSRPERFANKTFGALPGFIPILFKVTSASLRGPTC